LKIEYHVPVLLHTAVKFLINEELPAQIIVDGTLGGGGYTELICETIGDDDKVIAIDKDINALEFADSKLERFRSKILYVNGNFADIGKIFAKIGIRSISGLVLDLGLSSYQLESEDGFSFMKDTPLDMRAYKQDKLTAADILNEYTAEKLSVIFEEFGDIGAAKRLAAMIFHRRKVKKFATTFDIVNVIREGYKISKKNEIDFLAKIFQALRIEVNNEMKNLEMVLEDSMEYLVRGGRIVVISYHSLEDRRVKNFFRREASDKIESNDPYGSKSKEKRLKILTKKPVLPDAKEIRMNSRARSAKLRAAEKVSF